MKKMFISLFVCLFLLIGGTALAQDINTTTEANAGVTIDNSDNSESRIYDKSYVGSGVVPFAQTNGFFTEPTDDVSFRSIKEFIRYAYGPRDNIVGMSEGALEQLAKGGDTKIHFQIIRGNEQVPRVHEMGINPTNERFLWIGIEETVVINGKVIGTKKEENLRVTGFIDSIATNGHTNSFQVIAKAGLRALKDGNNFMIITKEGAHRKVEAKGWGIGTYGTSGNISKSGNSSSVVGGGTGYSDNETGTEDRPWIQGYVGCKEDMKFMEAE